MLKDFVFGDGSLVYELWLHSAHEISKILPNSHSLKMDLNAVMSNTQTPLFTASIYGLNEDICEMVQSPEFDVDIQDLIGYSGLYLAVVRGHHELVSLILDLGGDSTISDEEYADPLSAASANGHISVVRVLLNRDSLPNPSTTIEET